MRHVVARLQDRAEIARGNLRRVLRRTRPLEEMGGHPERVRRLPDPVEDLAYSDAAEELLDDGLAEIVMRTGWMR